MCLNNKPLVGPVIVGIATIAEDDDAIYVPEIYVLFTYCFYFLFHNCTRVSVAWSEFASQPIIFS